MKKLVDFRVIEGDGFFFYIGKEVRLFEGKTSDYIAEENEEYINCCFITHKTDKQLSGLIR